MLEVQRVQLLQSSSKFELPVPQLSASSCSKHWHESYLIETGDFETASLSGATVVALELDDRHSSLPVFR